MEKPSICTQFNPAFVPYNSTFFLSFLKSIQKFILCLFATMAFASIAFAQQQKSLSLQDSMDIWRAIQEQAAASTGRTVASVANSDCECPILDPTSNDCPGNTTKRACERKGCARIIRTGEIPHVETALCGFGATKLCTCDPATIDPPLQAGFTAKCQKSSSIMCADYKCRILDQSGQQVGTSLSSCGS